jgi:hypothetical protein
MVAIAASCGAQTVSLVEVQVTDLQPSYEAGKAIHLTPASAPPESLHARVFYDSVANLKRTRPGRDHCIRFYTTLISGIGYPNVINLKAINDQHLVRRGRDGMLQPVTVTLVFETGTLPEVGAFGLKDRIAVDNYFLHAIEIHLIASSDMASMQQQFEQQFMQHLQQPQQPVTPVATDTKAEEPPSVPCFDVNPHPVNEAGAGSESPGVTLVATVVPVGCGAVPVDPPASPRPSGF